MGVIVADLVFLTIGISSVLLGIKRGFIQTVVHFFKYILAFVIAHVFGRMIAEFMGFSQIVGYIVVFVLSLIGLWLLAKIVTRLIDHVRFLGKLNRFLGFLLGLLMGLTILFALSSILRFFLASTEFYQNTVLIKWFGDSRILHSLSFLDIGSGG